jgi:ubiquinone/menaquinone biosynthesis C-methylase UbiE
MKKTKIGITKESEWDKKWPTIFQHYQQDIRHAYYLNAFLDENDKKILEIAAGSFRDMAVLNNLGVECWGTDYSKNSVDLARKHFPLLKNMIFQSDAYNMRNINDNAFDATFHNGFWVLFDDNNEISALAKEQARITKRKMVVTVHNGHNKKFIHYFKKLSREDPLYRIRFFTIDEIRSLMLTVCKSVKIVPVGKGKKHFEDQMINNGVVDRKGMNAFFEDAEMKHIDISERLLCIGFL